MRERWKQRNNSCQNNPKFLSLFRRMVWGNTVSIRGISERRMTGLQSLFPKFSHPVILDYKLGDF